MSDHDFWASINRDSPRYADWAKVFDDPQHVPITTPITELVQLPIGARRALFVRCDLLGEDELHRLGLHLAERFNVEPFEVLADIERDPRKSVPILAEDVFVTVFHPQKWV